MKGFKKCNNGHFYKDSLLACPYCPKDNKTEVASEKTEIFTDDNNSVESTILDVTKTSSKKTEIIDSGVVGKIEEKKTGIISSKTVFGDDLDFNEENEKPSKQKFRSKKLVGWLVSYTLNNLGVDFRLYEGRNIIGRDMNCEITISDPTVTGKHAVLLFRAGKYKIKDELSSHGTFVNGTDIEDESIEVNDGDKIRVGQTVFLFKSSL